jgi:hypothetical protein
MNRDPMLEKAMRRTEGRVHATTGWGTRPIIFSIRRAEDGTYTYRPVPLPADFWDRFDGPSSDGLAALAATMTRPGAGIGGTSIASAVPEDLFGWAFMTEAYQYVVAPGENPSGEPAVDFPAESIRALSTMTVTNVSAVLVRSEVSNEVDITWWTFADTRSTTLDAFGTDPAVATSLHRLCQLARA